MGIKEDGDEGERKIGKLLETKGFKRFQVDWIGKKDGKYYLFEVKNQERFKAPPFDGQGLPKYQVEARLEFEKETNIKAILIVLDKETKEVFYQLLSKLNENPNNYIDTKGLKQRRVYKLDLFKKL